MNHNMPASMSKVEKLVLDGIKVFDAFFKSPYAGMDKGSRQQVQSPFQRTCNYASPTLHMDIT